MGKMKTPIILCFLLLVSNVFSEEQNSIEETPVVDYLSDDVTTGYLDGDQDTYPLYGEGDDEDDDVQPDEDNDVQPDDEDVQLDDEDAQPDDEDVQPDGEDVQPDDVSEDSSRADGSYNVPYEYSPWYRARRRGRRIPHWHRRHYYPGYHGYGYSPRYRYRGWPRYTEDPEDSLLIRSRPGHYHRHGLHNRHLRRGHHHGHVYPYQYKPNFCRYRRHYRSPYCRRYSSYQPKPVHRPPVHYPRGDLLVVNRHGVSVNPNYHPKKDPRINEDYQPPTDKRRKGFRVSEKYGDDRYNLVRNRILHIKHRDAIKGDVKRTASDKAGVSSKKKLRIKQHDTGKIQGEFGDKGSGYGGDESGKFEHNLKRKSDALINLENYKKYEKGYENKGKYTADNKIVGVDKLTQVKTGRHGYYDKKYLEY